MSLEALLEIERNYILTNQIYGAYHILNYLMVIIKNSN